MTLKKVQCTLTLGLVLLAANSYAQTVPAGYALPTRFLRKAPQWSQTIQCVPSTLMFRKRSSLTSGDA